MKTRKIIDLLDSLLGGERTKRSRRELAVEELLHKLEKKENKLLERLEHIDTDDEDEKRHLEIKLQVNRAHQDKARQAISSWSGTKPEAETETEAQ
jgi:hypothetical protein